MKFTSLILLFSSVSALQVSKLSTQQSLDISIIQKDASSIEKNLIEIKSLIQQGKKEEAKKLVQFTADEEKEIVEKVLANLDRPENGTWMRNVVNQVKGIQQWHDQIDELCKILGVAITGDNDPDYAKRVGAVNEAVAKAAADGTLVK